MSKLAELAERVLELAESNDVYINDAEMAHRDQEIEDTLHEAADALSRADSVMTSLRALCDENGYACASCDAKGRGFEHGSLRVRDIRALLPASDDAQQEPDARDET